jgi:hypothetical protein
VQTPKRACLTRLVEVWVTLENETLKASAIDQCRQELALRAMAFEPEPDELWFGKGPRIGHSIGVRPEPHLFPLGHFLERLEHAPPKALADVHEGVLAAAVRELAKGVA